ncbi:hypothetical protein AGDE_00495 [Angomonas deanei]|uniref:Kinase n=1 Tax=Angomonas deanei TaxID=59799 RepID=S9VD70_9TRYP|nr:hypothetical protein AGDE_05201 [Angomonas deanei]EPY43426.1 hypothetical protein AGDE_00495 [Angomonas deanei]CAD2216714.1 Inositol polyphosphate kinase, putative [Angomonas deanei]|eukprot:EPY38728.1 hypothetical protein AGDE_05201 [Angomonas deanei]
MALRVYDDRYDKTSWGVGLIDQTGGIEDACVMDVKLGCYRTSPLTPEAKAATAEEKDAGKIMRRCGARLVWLKRFIKEGGALVPEVITSKNNHTIEKETEFKNILYAFFSSFGKIEETGNVDRSDVEVKGPNPADYPEEEKKKCQSLRQRAVKPVDDLLNFYENTPEGKFLIENFAFVSSSLLFVYDAKNPENCDVKLIDLGRSGPRYLNFDEKKLGFIQGLHTVSEYLK